MLTCRGNTFAGRVAVSQLQSLGLTELVTSTLAEYTALALWLAEDRTCSPKSESALARTGRLVPCSTPISRAPPRGGLHRHVGAPPGRRADRRASMSRHARNRRRRRLPASGRTRDCGCTGGCRCERDYRCRPASPADAPAAPGGCAGDPTFRRRCCATGGRGDDDDCRTTAPGRPILKPGRRRHIGDERSNSIGTIGASLELRSVSVVLTLST